MNKKAGTGTAFGLIVLMLIGLAVYFVYFSPDKEKYQDQINQTTNHNATNNWPVSVYPRVPGDILTNNLTVICVSGYSATVRDVPQSLREEVFARDNVPYPQPTGTTELDHVIPLCLGGSNDIKNLFVEFAEPKPGYKEKDRLENYLCDHVCSGDIEISYAQQRIAQDWYSYYLEVYG